MAVINNTTLLVRRIGELRRRRDALAERQEGLRAAMPDWTFAPLKLVGMTSDEIRAYVDGIARREEEVGLDDLEREIEALDQQIEEFENMLLTRPAQSLEGIAALLAVSLIRLRSQTTTDPADIFYDYGEARILTFLERANDDLQALLREAQRTAS